MQGLQKIQEQQAVSDFARTQFSQQPPALSSQSMLAGIDLITPKAIDLLSSSAKGLKDEQLSYLFRLNDKQIKDAMGQGLAYSSALWEDILGVRGTGSKRVEGPWEKRPPARIEDKEAKKVLRSIYDEAVEAYSSASKALASKAGVSMSAREFAANVLNNSYSQGVANSHTVSQFTSNALGNVEKSALAMANVQRPGLAAASIEKIPVGAGIGLSAISAESYMAAHAPQAMPGYSEIEISTAQALAYYFQEHPEDYDEVMLEALALESPDMLSNISLLEKKIKKQQKLLGRLAFSDKLLWILVEKKKKKGLLGKFLSQFGFRIDKGSKTVFVCKRARSGLSSRLPLKPLKSMKS